MTITASAPHIDDLDPDTAAATFDGTTHVGPCPVLVDDIVNAGSGSVPAISTLSAAIGWLCGTCIDARPRLVNPVLVTANKGFTGTGIAASNHGGRSFAAKPASEKALAFLRSLAAELDTDLTTLADDDGHFSAKTASRLIDMFKTELAARPAAAFDPVAITAACEARKDTKFTADEMTPELSAFATDWALGYEGDFSFMLDMKAAARKKGLTPGMAKGVLNCFLADLRRNPSPDAPAEVEMTEGLYENPAGEVFKIKISGAGRWYAMAAKASGGWDYVGRKTDGDLTPLTEEAAAAFGKLTGTCCVCMRTLTNEESIERGIGPVCLVKAGWA